MASVLLAKRGRPHGHKNDIAKSGKGGPPFRETHGIDITDSKPDAGLDTGIRQGVRTPEEKHTRKKELGR